MAGLIDLGSSIFNKIGSALSAPFGIRPLPSPTSYGLTRPIMGIDGVPIPAPTVGNPGAVVNVNPSNGGGLSIFDNTIGALGKLPGWIADSIGKIASAPFKGITNAVKDDLIEPLKESATLSIGTILIGAGLLGVVGIVVTKIL